MNELNICRKDMMSLSGLQELKSKFRVTTEINEATVTKIYNL